MRAGPRTIAMAACLALGSAASVAVPAPARAGWPQVELPDGARADSIGDDMRLNGVPTRILRFSSAQEPAAVLDFFRGRWGTRRVENSVGPHRLLGRREGDYFITVRVQAHGRGTAGLVSVADLRAGSHARQRPAGVPLPADSVVLSDLESVDGARRARQLVVANAAGSPANAAFFESRLADKGLRLQRREGSGARQTLWFDGEGREAMLVLSQQAKASHAVLTLVNTQSEALP
jgi:hypothetical protein